MKQKRRKYAPEQIQKARRMLETQQYTQREIAAACGIHQCTVDRIKKGEYGKAHQAQKGVKCPRCYRIVLQFPCLACVAERSVELKLASKRQVVGR